MFKILAALVFTLSFSFNSFADVVFEMGQKQISPEANHKTKGMVQGNNFKMDFYENGTKLDGAMIYRGDKKEMIMVNHQDKTYVVLDQATMNELVSVMSEAMKQFEEAMKDATPEEREMMEKMMKGKMPGMGGAEDVEPVLKKVGTGKANGYSCTKYDVFRGEVKISQHCVAPWNSIDGGDEMKTVMLEMAQFMDQMAKSFSKSKGIMGQQIQFENNVFNQLRKLNGFPVQTIDYENGTVESESNFVSSKKVSLNPNDLEPPAGYKKQDMGLR
jgi:hypothetical protein